MKPNKPNTEFESKTFAKVNGLTIVGNFVSQQPDVIIPQQTDRGINEKKLNKLISTNPSLIGRKGDRGEKGDPAQLPEPPKFGIWVLGSIEGKIQWIETEDCAV